MGRIFHIECPECRAPIGISQGERIVTCKHCQAKSLVEGHSFIPEYYLKSQVDEQTARRVLQKILQNPDVPSGMLKRSRLVSAQLNYLPFNEIKARRIGTMLIAEKNGNLGEMDPEDRQGKDTRVVLSDVRRIAPAVELKNWGLEHAEVAKFWECEHGIFARFERKRLAGGARINEPTIDPEKMIEEMKSSKMAASVRDETEYVEKRAQRLFYPVWRLRYTYKGAIFSATVDAVTGNVMAASAPENDRNRVKWLLGLCMFVAFILGKFIRSAIILINNPEDILAWASSGAHVFALIFVTGIFFIAVAIAVGWEQFRYPGMVVWRGEDYESVKVNRPENNRALVWIFEMTELVEKTLKRRRE